MDDENCSNDFNLYIFFAYTQKTIRIDVPNESGNLIFFRCFFFWFSVHQTFYLFPFRVFRLIVCLEKPGNWRNEITQQQKKKKVKISTKYVTKVSSDILPLRNVKRVLLLLQPKHWRMINNIKRKSSNNPKVNNYFNAQKTISSE